MGALPALREEPPPPTARPSLSEEAAARLRRYSLLVTVAMMILCNAIFLGGMWISGLNLDKLIRIPDHFNPMQDVCLRFTWRKVEGDTQPIRLCSEWLNLSDPSGETHKIQSETEVVKGGDGRLYFDDGEQVDYRLFVFGAFVVSIIVFGVWLKRVLIRRYRLQLERYQQSSFPT
ncbi:hypothetical protein [Candidatus Nitrospira bockiana]